LQFLVELPSRLSKSVELEAYSQAVKYYNKTAGILKRYDNLPSFQSIQVECKQIIQVLKEKLQTRIKDPKVVSVVIHLTLTVVKTSTSDVIEAATLLIDLGVPPTVLRGDYLQW
jgi:hypothetical protein